MRTPLSAARGKLLELVHQTPAAHKREGYVWRLQDAVDAYVEEILDKGAAAKFRGSFYIGKTVEIGRQCNATTHAGRRCSRDATVFYAPRIAFCVQHSRSKDAQKTSRGKSDSFASLLPEGRRIMWNGRLIIQLKSAAGTRKTRKRSKSGQVQTSKKKRAISYRKLKRRAKRSHNPRRPKDSL